MLVHNYVDAFAVDPRAERQCEVRRLRRAIATLNAELDRLDARIYALDRRAAQLPDNDWGEDMFNILDWKIERLSKRFERMAQTIWQFEEELHWKYDA